jgi:hypothetical protein
MGATTFGTMTRLRMTFGVSNIYSQCSAEWHFKYNFCRMPLVWASFFECHSVECHSVECHSLERHSLRGILLSVILLNTTLLGLIDILLSVILLSMILWSVIMPNIILLSLPNVILPNVVLLNVMAPQKGFLDPCIQSLRHDFWEKIENVLTALNFEIEFKFWHWSFEVIVKFVIKSIVFILDLNLKETLLPSWMLPINQYLINFNRCC